MSDTLPRLASLADDSALEDAFWPSKQAVWPEFMFHDRYAGTHWDEMLARFQEWQLYLLDDDGAPVAVAQTIPCVWDSTLGGLPVGWAEGLVLAVESARRGETPNTLMAVEISIAPSHTGRGISYTMLNAVRERAAAAGYQAVIVAVRPSLKPRYPITPMERYCRWTRPDGLPFDPWLRAHVRVGGEILHMAHPSMVIEGTADEWEAWAGMKFPDSGDYVVDGAMVPVQIDREMNFGRYVEPNVWVHHPITTGALRVVHN
jgi:GNAT superfamily N-acetyltransferase